MNMKSALLGRPTANHQSPSTPDALAKAFENADRRVPEKQSSQGFLVNHLEPSAAALLERRRKILEGLASPDATLEALAAAQLAPGASAPESVTLSASTLPEIEREIVVKRRAIEMQRSIAERARSQWSTLVCNELKNLHRRQVEPRRVLRRARYVRTSSSAGAV
jgi:hypothetical protein